MKRQAFNLSSSSSAVRPVSASLPQFIRRLSIAGATRSSASMPSIGGLWNPALLDRLQAPLTRFRD